MKVHKNTEVQAIIDAIDQLYGQGEMQAFKAQNDKLHAEANKRNDRIISIIARYNDISMAYVEEDFAFCRHMLLSLLPECQAANLDIYVLKIYNTLGIIESEQAYYYESFKYYLKALEIANKSPELNSTGFLLNNIGNLLVWLKEYEAALPYLEKGYLKTKEEDLQSRVEITTILINIIECISYLNQPVEMCKWIDIFYKYAELDEEFNVVECIQLAYDIAYAYDKGEYGKFDNFADKLIANTQKCNEYIYQFRALLRALQYCIQIEDKALCDKLIKRMDEMNLDSNIHSFVFDYANLKILYYAHFLKGKVSLEVCEAYMQEYYNHSLNEIKQMNQTYNHNIIVQTELAKIELDKQNILDQNLILEREIELDHFTKLFNKISICGRIKTTIDKMSNHEKYAMLLVDVDYFKAVNDTYGHAIGDQVLKDVVATLKEIENDHIMIGRFGGDEFLIFYYPYNNTQDPQNLARRLVEKGSNIQIPNANGKCISFSVGVAQAQKKTDFDTLFALTDEALYACKEAGRNNYFIMEN